MFEIAKKFREFFKRETGMNLPPLDFGENITHASSYKLAYEQVDWDEVSRRIWDDGASLQKRDDANLRYDAELLLRLAEMVEKAMEIDKLDHLKEKLQYLDNWGAEGTKTEFHPDVELALSFMFVRGERILMNGALVFHPNSNEWNSHT